MSVHQAHPAFEHVLDIIEQAIEAFADIVGHRELLVKVKNIRVFIFLPEFATHNSECNWLRFGFGARVGVLERVVYCCSVTIRSG